MPTYNQKGFAVVVVSTQGVGARRGWQQPVVSSFHLTANEAKQSAAKLQAWFTTRILAATLTFELDKRE